MIRKYFIPALALAGLAVATAVVLHDDAPAAAGVPHQPGPSSPFTGQVAGTGIVEADGGSAAIGTPVAGIVKRIAVRWGDHVSTGDILFQIDDADLRAHLPQAEARVREAQAKLAVSQNAMALIERVPDRRAVSAEEVDNRRLAVKVDEAAVASARAAIEEIALETRRRSVRAQATGTVLQIRTHPGEYVDGATPIMVVGNDRRLQVRVDIDENDASRVHPEAPAEIILRDDPTHHVMLRFERIEPMVIPKAALTGAGAEHVDTRVMQVIYTFDPKTIPVHIGQQVDVFIDASNKRPGSAQTMPAVGMRSKL